MKKLSKSRKAVSPVVSTVLMVLIVMAGMTILFAFIGAYAESFQSGSGSTVLESLTVEDAWFNPSPTDHNLYIWVYNVGKVDFQIGSVYVNGTKASSSVYDSDGVIKIGEHVRVFVGPWQDGNSYALKIVTMRGAGFEGTYSP